MELTQEIKDIMSKGVPVEYTSEKALPKKEALELVDKLLEANIPVLGGEVVSWDAKGILSYNYDGWYCNFSRKKLLPIMFVEVRERLKNTYMHIRSMKCCSLLDLILILAKKNINV